ncbi:MAG: EAL domain-containing protein [Gammaproteobacteria bacterium]
MTTAPLEQILDACHAGVIVVDGDGAIRTWNAWMAHATGLPATTVRGRRLVDVFGSGISTRLLDAVDDALRGGLSAVLSPRLNHHPLPLERVRNGSGAVARMHQYVSVGAIKLDADSNRRGCVINVSDISAAQEREFKLRAQAEELHALTAELMRTQDQARHLAFHDALTGLANRSLFQDRVHMAVEHARRHASMCAVMLIDIDDFKHVNDTYGHDVGDALLREVAHRVRGCLRATDTAARLGGDEFAVIQTDLASPHGAEVLAHKIIDKLREARLVGGHELAIRASLGIAVFPHDGDNAAELLKRADLAMYVSKRAGGCGWRCYSDEMGSMLLRRQRVVQALREAIEQRQFVAHYQPVINLTDGSIAGYETLLRWQHPQHGLTLPGEFIETAEEAGLITAISDLLLEQVCADCAAWPAARRPRALAVNVSPVQFRDATLAEKLCRTSDHLAALGTRLEIEITEGVLMADTEHALATLTRLAAHGIAVAIDDFGTGYSSLAYLQRFPVGKIKIDRTFVAALSATDGKALIANTIIGLGHSLGHAVVAEGIESPEQAARLRELGCDLAQGFLFSRPLPLAELPAANEALGAAAHDAVA